MSAVLLNAPAWNSRSYYLFRFIALSARAPIVPAERSPRTSDLWQGDINGGHDRRRERYKRWVTPSVELRLLAWPRT
jgi:hypothetical protein